MVHLSLTEADCPVSLFNLFSCFMKQLYGIPASRVTSLVEQQSWKIDQQYFQFCLFIEMSSWAGGHFLSLLGIRCTFGASNAPHPQCRLCVLQKLLVAKFLKAFSRESQNISCCCEEQLFSHPTSRWPMELSGEYFQQSFMNLRASLQ